MNANASVNKLNTYCVTGLIAIGLVMSSFFAAAQEKKNDDVQALEVEADTLTGRQDFEGAIKLYDKILEKTKLKNTDDYRILYKRAYAYYGLHKFDQALQDVNQYIGKTADPQGKLLRAYINQELGNYKEELDDLNEFVASNPGNADLLRWRVSILMESGDYAKAQKDLQTLLIAGQDPELESYLGLTYYYQEKPDSALIIFDKVIAKEPSYVQAYLFAGSLCLEQEAYDLAIRYIDKGLKQDPANVTLLFYKGAALVETTKREEGCRLLTKAFKAGFHDAADYLKEYCYSGEE